jgi:hypothetical protein
VGFDSPHFSLSPLFLKDYSDVFYATEIVANWEATICCILDSTGVKPKHGLKYFTIPKALYRQLLVFSFSSTSSPSFLSVGHRSEKPKVASTLRPEIRVESIVIELALIVTRLHAPSPFVLHLIEQVINWQLHLHSN